MITKNEMILVARELLIGTLTSSIPGHDEIRMQRPHTEMSEEEVGEIAEIYVNGSANLAEILATANQAQRDAERKHDG